MIIITVQLIQIYDYRGIPLAKILIDLIYFFPFGFIMLNKLLPHNRFSYFLKSSALVLASASVGMYGVKYIINKIVNNYQLTSYENFIVEIILFLMIYSIVCSVLFVKIKRKV